MDEQFSQSVVPRHHVHTGLFALIGVLIMSATGIGLYALQKEQVWNKSYTELQAKLDEAEKKIATHESKTYSGPYGVLSYVKYNQVQSVPSSFPLSQVAAYSPVSCESLTDAGGKPMPSNSFGVANLPQSSALRAWTVEDQAAFDLAVQQSLTWEDPNQKSLIKTRAPLYNLSSICALSEDKVLLVGFDYANSALRVPIWVDREDGSWIVRRLPPTLTPFVTSTVVRLHPDGNPMIFDVYQGETQSAWQAYYLDTKFQSVDLVESCRIVKQGDVFVRICERLYEQG